MLSERRKAQLGLVSLAVGLTICSAVLVRGTFYTAPVPFAAAGIAAPQFTLADADGRSVSLIDYRGKTLVLFFGSTRCSKTSDYNARVEQLAHQYSSDSRVQFFAVNVSATPIDPREVRVDAKMSERTFPTLLDERARVADLFSAVQTPRMVIVDPNGIVSYNGAFDDNSNPKLVTQRYCADALRAAIGAPAGTPTLAAAMR